MPRRMTYDVDKLAGWLSDDAEETAKNNGGYPNEVAVVADHIVIAGIIDDGPTLDIYTPAQCRQWFRDVLVSRKEYPGEEMFFHLWENAPETVVQRS